MKVLILFIMIFLHLIDDYKVQGIMANMKQKEWWEKQTNNKLYKNDYKIVLLEHAFSWSFSITIPFLYIAITQNNLSLTILLLIGYIYNTLVHAIIDDAKANEHTINLITDQLFHLAQIGLTWILMILTF